MKTQTKRFSSAIAVASILTISGIGVSIELGTIQPIPAVAQTTSCDTNIRTESFSRRVGSTTGINLRSDRNLNARTSQNLNYNQTYAFDAWAYGQSVNDLWTGKPDALWYRHRDTQLWVPSAYMVGYPPSNPPIQPNCTGPSGQINLPFRSGQTWYVCQGYNGTISHQNSFGMDLTVARDFGSNNACWAADGNVNKSAAKEVLAPVAGTVSYVNSDLVCLTVNSNQSLLIGHMNRKVQPGQFVSKDTVLGTVSWASSANGGYAHIHVEAFRSANCSRGTSVPFTSAYGFQFGGIGDLPGNQTQWKRELRRP